MSAAVERIATECGRGLPGRSDRQRYFPVRSALAYRVSKVVGEVEHVIGTRCSAVGIGEADILAPGA